MSVEGVEFLACLPAVDRRAARAIIDDPELGFREVAEEITRRWPDEARAVWGEWVSYRKGVGMDLYEALHPGKAYA